MRHAPAEGNGPPQVQAGSIGHGALEFLASTRTAVVHDDFDHGFYLAADHQVIAVVGGPVSDGPLYIRIEVHMPAPAVGTTVRIVDGQSIVGPEWELTTGTSRRYAPTLPTPPAGLDLLEHIEAPVPPDLQAVWPAVEDAARLGDRRGVRDLVAGRGRGLTPEGDDVLAGAFVVWAMIERRHPELLDLAATAPTTNLSRAFLRWAAVGQCITELHHLLWTADRGRWHELARAQERVRAIGGSTGAALLAGIRLGATFSLAPPDVLRYDKRHLLSD